MDEPRCMRCGAPLVKVSDDERMTPPYWEEESGEPVEEYRCPECLTYHTVTPVDPESKDAYPAYNKEAAENFVDSYHGYDGECPKCGSHIVWSSDFMRSEVWGDVEDDEDTLVSYVSCPYCGAYIELVEATDKEREEAQKAKEKQD